MRYLLLIAAAVTGLVVTTPASAQVRGQGIKQSPRVYVVPRRNPDAFIRDYQRSDPPGAHWND